MSVSRETPPPHPSLEQSGHFFFEHFPAFCDASYCDLWPKEATFSRKYNKRMVFPHREEFEQETERTRREHTIRTLVKKLYQSILFASCNETLFFLHYADNFFLPCALLRARTSLPPFVAVLARKPCSPFLLLFLG